MTHEIVSDRVRMRPVAADDFSPLHALWVDEEVRRFLWDGEIIPEAQTREIIAQNGVLFADQGFGLWGVAEAGSDTLIAAAGYWYFRDPPDRELIFAVAPAQWGRGIATHVSELLLRFAFERLEVDAVDASTDLDNVASSRVLAKLGMTLVRRDVVDGLETLFYRITRSEWERRVAAS